MTNLRNAEGYVASFWDWTIYNDCFGGTAIRITDVDGLVERRGHFLLIETKKPNEEIPTGQRILFTQFSKLPRCYVLIIYGEVDQPIAYQLWGYNKNRLPATTLTIKDLLMRWYRYADRNGK